ncbi:MAG TPA: acyl-ACP thioesterase [Candidatus Alistipes intestinigallinarum]|uniref:Acyl-ACP thioesterase n=1 Tax=Candidatus Alistipes intestinigallinarum TaxID=2838440 RepID=A0A9D1Z0U8_9BACT|nr:acyl-ACP thioesterase [Candidatus Alistipes intestinigallinarum]
MAEKSLYNYRVEPQEVDFTLRATLASLGSSILNTAGVDAYGKGFGVDVLNADNHSWVLSRMAIEIDRRPEQYTDYTVATWISDYGRVLSTRNFTLTDAAGCEFGRAVTQWAMIDLTTRSAVDLSWVGREHEEAVVPVPPPAAMPRKIRSVTPTQRTEHRVVYSDIDFNRHVNTMRYIEMMLDMLPVELLTCEAPVRLDIHFLKECRFGQTLSVGCELRDRSALFEISADGATAAVRAGVEWQENRA